MLRKYQSCLIVAVLMLMPQLSAAEEPKPASTVEKASVADIIPLTMGNIRGHKMLYNEGWTIVTSSSRAFDYAREKSIVSSGEALQQVARDASRRTGSYKEAIKDDVQDSVKTGKDIVVSGTEKTGKILGDTHQLAKTELAYSGESFRKAMNSFVRGNLTLGARTEEERNELVNIPGNYYKSLKNDFSNVYELTEPVRKQFAEKIDPGWETAFQKAGKAFQAEYERSGEQPNSLMALGPILAGYLKSLYHGLVAPVSKTIVKTTVQGTTYAVFLPVAATSIVAGRTVQSVGLTVYYVGKTGVKVVSPTIEGGLLSGLSLLSLSAVPITYTAGGAWGAMNQVAFTTAGPVVGTVEAAATTTVHSAGYVGFLAYDAVKGTTQVVINQAASGLVLGYNALTAIPTHVVLGAVDTAVFLAWDGPRLAIASAQGRIRSGKDSGSTETFSLGDLPVGTVVDLQKLKTEEGVHVEILSTDPAVIKGVLEKTPEDLRVKTNGDH